jgi:hypothetical protein
MRIDKKPLAEDRAPIDLYAPRVNDIIPYGMSLKEPMEPEPPQRAP